jgi:GNAT superfamily N-acetyltransferase
MSAWLASVEDAAPLGRSLAVAYETNPLVRWMLSDDLSGARLTGLFTALVELGLRDGSVYRSENGEGAAIWFPPTAGDGTGVDVAGGTSAWTSGRRSATLAILAAARPSEPHFYLDAVGVIPGHRRRGIAANLLAPLLAVCNAKRLPAYLENSDPANTGFYARHGFLELGPLPMPADAPVIVGMWRTPQTP